ncbi:hypothetical protein ACNSO7_04655, partial [Yersinia enterocolitica]|uniref:hypothetical protein n=5 Tax=Yersinia enterocolitica TaxID=630 RepID=UPI00092CFD7D
MPNSEVKRRSADGSVGSPHARVGHCQASNQAKTPCQKRGVFAFLLSDKYLHTNKQLVTDNRLPQPLPFSM